MLRVVVVLLQEALLGLGVLIPLVVVAHRNARTTSRSNRLAMSPAAEDDAVLAVLFLLFLVVADLGAVQLPGAVYVDVRVDVDFVVLLLLLVQRRALVRLPQLLARGDALLSAQRHALAAPDRHAAAARRGSRLAVRGRLAVSVHLDVGEAALANSRALSDAHRHSPEVEGVRVVVVLEPASAVRLARRVASGRARPCLGFSPCSFSNRHRHACG